MGDMGAVGAVYGARWGAVPGVEGNGPNVPNGLGPAAAIMSAGRGGDGVRTCATHAETRSLRCWPLAAADVGPVEAMAIGNYHMCV